MDHLLCRCGLIGGHGNNQSPGLNNSHALSVRLAHFTPFHNESRALTHMEICVAQKRRKPVFLLVGGICDCHASLRRVPLLCACYVINEHFLKIHLR